MCERVHCCACRLGGRFLSGLGALDEASTLAVLHEDVQVPVRTLSHCTFVRFGTPFVFLCYSQGESDCVVTSPSHNASSSVRGRAGDEDNDNTEFRTPSAASVSALVHSCMMTSPHNSSAGYRDSSDSSTADSITPFSVHSTTRGGDGNSGDLSRQKDAATGTGALAIDADVAAFDSECVLGIDIGTTSVKTVLVVATTGEVRWIFSVSHFLIFCTIVCLMKTRYLSEKYSIFPFCIFMLSSGA